MPVLGGSGQSNAPAGLGNGWAIPSGALDRWRAARDASATTPAHIVAFGDSTTYGSGYDLANASRSMWQQVRTRAIAAGFTDGGRGAAPAEDYLALALPDTFKQSAGATNWAAGTGLYNSQSWVTSTSSAAIALRGMGRYCRLHWNDASGTATRFSYTIDGGSSVNVAAQNQANTYRPTVIDLGTDGDHTVTITNTTGTLSITGEFYRAAGVVIHNQGTPGGRGRTIWPPNANYGSIAQPAPAALGLSTIFENISYRNPLASGGRTPVLSSYAFGINDMYDTNLTPANYASDILDLEQSIGHWAAVCDAVSCDKLVICSDVWFGATSGSPRYAGTYRAAIRSAANAVGAAWVDATTAIGMPRAAFAAGYAGSDNEPHLTPAGYNKIGDFIWDNVLSK